MFLLVFLSLCTLYLKLETDRVQKEPQLKFYVNTTDDKIAFVLDDSNAKSNV